MKFNVACVNRLLFVGRGSECLVIAVVSFNSFVDEVQSRGETSRHLSTKIREHT